MKKVSHGFTLIELMLVVAIVSLLAAIAIPKFSNLIVKAKEASVKAQLGALRSAFTIYYSDNEGLTVKALTPDGLTTLLVPKYIKEIPRISIPTVSESIHPRVNRTHFSDFENDGAWNIGENRAWFARTFTSMGMTYMTGYIGVNCTHPDLNGRTWSTW